MTAYSPDQIPEPEIDEEPYLCRECGRPVEHDEDSHSCRECGASICVGYSYRGLCADCAGEQLEQDAWFGWWDALVGLIDRRRQTHGSEGVPF